MAGRTAPGGMKSRADGLSWPALTQVWATRTGLISSPWSAAASGPARFVGGNGKAMSRTDLGPRLARFDPSQAFQIGSPDDKRPAQSLMGK
jgi:hypothetical protein